MIDFHFAEFASIVLFYFAGLVKVALPFLLHLLQIDARISAALRPW